MKTTVVNLRAAPFDVYIGRAGRGQDGYFGNPFAIVPGRQTREQAIARYAEWFANAVENDPAFRARVLALRGKRLGCFCKPAACHGDVIAAYLDEVPA